MSTASVRYAAAILVAATPWFASAQMGVPDECGPFRTALSFDLGMPKEQKETIESSSYLVHTFIWENDMFAGDGDIHYTNGMKLSWLHSPCRHLRRHQALKSGYRTLLQALSPQNTEFRVHSGGLVGMNMYTPQDKDEANRIRTDRPYAGWVYVGWNLQAARMQHGQLSGDEHQLELQLGFTGGKTAQREIQEYIHRNISDSRISQGWDHQIGQRIGVNALYAYRKDYSPLSQENWVRIVPHAGFNLGNLIQFVNAGGMLMLGKSAGDYPGTSNQPIRLDARSTQGQKEEIVPNVRPAPVLYAFAGLDARYIFSSAFIEGFGASKHDIELKHDVYDLLGGIAGGTEAWRLSLKLIHRSKEFTSPDPSKARSHRIGQIGFTWFY